MKIKWEEPTCNLCGSSKNKVLYDSMTYWEYDGVFRTVLCTRCKLVFVNPRPVLKDIHNFYENKNYFGRDIKIGEEKNDIDEREEAYGNIYKIILNQRSKGSILDIGAGTGLFLSKFKDLKWNVTGIELTTPAVKYAKKQYGIKLLQGDFLKYNFKKESYDVITLNGALEHLHDPLQTLEKIYPLLKKDGILIFSVPNVESIGNKIFGRDWFPWQPPRHLYHFSPNTITKMVNKAGFKYVRIYHNYWVHNKYIIFQSIRYKLSPKFEKKETGGLKKQKVVNKKTFKKEIGKFIAEILSYSIAFIEPYIKKGEIQIVYVKKN